MDDAPTRKIVVGLSQLIAVELRALHSEESEPNSSPDLMDEIIRVKRKTVPELREKLENLAPQLSWR